MTYHMRDMKRLNDDADDNDMIALRRINAELLAALERSLDWLASYPGGGTMGEKGPYMQARAALKLAKGE